MGLHIQLPFRPFFNSVVAQVLEKHPAAEQFAADLKLLSHVRKEERIRGCERVAEAGSAALRTLLELTLSDEPEVRHEAIWSVVRIGDDLRVTAECDRAVIAGLMAAVKTHPDPFLRVAGAAIEARKNGASAARAAYQHDLITSGGRESALALLERMVREEPQRDPELPEVLSEASQHRDERVRRRAEELLRMHQEESEVHLGSAGANGLLRGSLQARRAAVGMITPNEQTAPDLLRAALSDPDRTVRRQASVKLFAYLRDGERLALPESLDAPGEEFQGLLVLNDGRVKANPAMLPCLMATIEGGTAVAKQRVVSLMMDLRPIVGADEGKELDRLLILALRDKDREVRRYATAATRVFGSEAHLTVMKGRIKQSWLCRTHRAAILSILMAALLAGIVSALGYGAFALPVAMLSERLMRAGRYLLRRKDAPPIDSDEFYETLCALEPTADTHPEQLTTLIPQLKSLASRMGSMSPEVRSKARELLAKVHEATLHELPIAADGPSVEPESLPIPGAAQETREVSAR